MFCVFFVFFGVLVIICERMVFLSVCVSPSVSALFARRRPPETAVIHLFKLFLQSVSFPLGGVEAVGHVLVFPIEHN